MRGPPARRAGALSAQTCGHEIDPKTGREPVQRRCQVCPSAGPRRRGDFPRSIRGHRSRLGFRSWFRLDGIECVATAPFGDRRLGRQSVVRAAAVGTFHRRSISQGQTGRAGRRHADHPHKHRQHGECTRDPIWASAERNSTCSGRSVHMLQSVTGCAISDSVVTTKGHRVAASRTWGIVRSGSLTSNSPALPKLPGCSAHRSARVGHRHRTWSDCGGTAAAHG